MAKQVIEVEILAVLKEATKSVKDFTKQTQKELDGINFKTAVSALNDGFELIEKTAGRAFGAIKGFMADAIQEAINGEEEITRLSNSMRLVGDFSESAVTEMKAFAGSLQDVTTFSRGVVTESLAVAKNFGLTNKQAREATRAAADFAAATGKDLQSAVQSVSRTLMGFVDKDLAKYIPTLKKVSIEQLAMGEGIRAIGERFKGFAEAMGATFQGALTMTRNKFNDLMGTIGELITTNPVVIQSIKVIGDTFGELSGVVGDNEKQLSSFISEAVKGIAALAPVTIQAVKGADFLLTSISNLFQSTGKLAAGFFAALQAEREGNSAGAREAAQESIREIQDLYRNASQRQKSFYDPLIKAAQDASDKIQKLGIGNLKNGKITLSVPRSEAQILADQMKAALEAGGDKLKRQIEEAFNEQKKVVETLSKNPLASLFPAAKPGDKLKFSPDQQAGIATGAGALGSVLKGAAGAQDLFKGLASAAADALIPGLGAVAGEIVGVLSQGPEKVKQMIQEFAKAVPDIIEAIILSIPVLIEELAKAVPQVIERLTERAPEIIQALVRAIPDVVIALQLQMPKIAFALIEGIIKGIPDIITGFVEGLIGAAGDFVDALIDAITGVGGDIWGGITGQDSGGIFEGIPILGGIGDLFGFAEGGRVPDMPQYRGDNFPARLDAGEQVFSRDLTQRLEQFLDGNAGGGTQTIILQVGQQELARTILTLNRGGFRTA